MRPPGIHQGLDGTSFFVTTVTRSRIPYFSIPEHAKTAQEMIHWYKENDNFWLLEYVIMPDHMHLLIAPKNKKLSDCMHDLKRTIAQKINIHNENPDLVGQERSCPTRSGTLRTSIWQSSFQDIIVRTPKQIEAFRHYIFHNPVKAGLSKTPEEYPFSSMTKETDRHRMAVGMQFPDHLPALLLATSNPGKITEISTHLRDMPLDIVSTLDLPYIESTPEETSSTFQKNALQKARFYFDQSGIPTLADDSGIIVEALEKELGIHTRRWGAGPKATDEEWISHFLERMRKEKNKRARFVCVLAYIDQQGKEYLFEGTCDGVITDTLEARYLPGLPISACFRPDGHKIVYSAMDIEQKNCTSHRGKALSAFQKFLKFRNRNTA